MSDRIHRVYGRSSVVIHPPVETAPFNTVAPRTPGEYFLATARLVLSKRVDLIIQAANAAAVPLVIEGTGPDEPRLRRLAGPTVRFTGWLPQSDLPVLVSRAIAVVFAPIEDFGIVPVEAMAAGTPVIAYGEGGALETVVAGKTGEFFHPQTTEALAEVIRAFRKERYDAATCRERRGLRRRRISRADRKACGRIACKGPLHPRRHEVAYEGHWGIVSR